MNLRLGITPKLALILTAFVGFLLLGFGLPSTYQGFHALEEAAKTELFSTSGEKVLSIENWLIDREAHIIGLGHSHELARLVDDLRLATPGSTREKILRGDLKRRLWEWTVTSPDYRSLMILDPQTGIVVASTNPDRIGQSKTGQTFFTQGLLKTYVQSLGDHLTPTAGVMVISTPLLSVDGDIVGVLAAEVSVETLWSIVNAQNPYRSSVDAYLVNPARALVTLPRDVILKEANQLKIETPAADLCLQGKSGVMTTQDYRGQPSITAYHWMPAQQVCMIVEERRSEAVAPLRGYAQVITIAGGLAVILTFVLAYFIANRVTRPVLALQQGVERISNGELDFRLPARSSDELGVLEREFNRMAQRLADKELQLASYANELEEKVLERTEELRASEAEMRALIAAMTDVILVFDSEGTYLKVPNARQENLVLPAEEIVG
ncbi:MAG TPA: HAMP domain-containing protein, partial [Anaerolineaceae bacterium]|nr:HAMP domain-containing protein [Anaerolineaceae bacterium]